MPYGNQNSKSCSAGFLKVKMVRLEKEINTNLVLVSHNNKTVKKEEKNPEKKCEKGDWRL